MDKYEYRERTEEMLALAEKKQYKEAMEIADMIDWKRVKSIFMLSAVSEIYEHNGDYKKSRQILKLAYDKQPGSRKMAYRLGTLALKENDLITASDFYEEFVKIAPKDPNQYILKYKILKAQNGDIQEQIAALEEFKEAEYIEKWAYELATLYHQAGRTAECLEECDDLILWFSDGKYVYRAMELKMKYKPLTPHQQVKYDNRPGAQARRAAAAKAEAEEKAKAKAAEAAKLAAERSAAKAAKAAAEVATAESVVEAVAEPVVEAVAEPVAEAVAESVEKVIAEPVVAPVEEKVTDASLRATGQMKIDSIVRAWEEKQKENADAIEKLRQEEAARIQAEKEAAEKRREEERLEIERMAAEAEAARLAEEAARKAAEEEAARIAAEEEAARKAAEEEAARIAAEEEAARVAAEEEAARKAAEEEAARVAAEEEAARKAAEEEAARLAEEEKAKILDEKTRRIPDDIVRLMEELEYDMTGEIETPKEVQIDEDMIRNAVESFTEEELEEEDFEEEDFDEYDFEEESLEEDTSIEVPVEEISEETTAIETADENLELTLEDEDFEEEDFEEEPSMMAVPSMEEEEPEYEEVIEAPVDNEFAEVFNQEEQEEEDSDFEIEEETAEEEFTEAAEDGFAELKMSDEAVAEDFDEEDFDEEEFEEAVLEALAEEKKEEATEEDFEEEDFEEEELEEDEFEEEELKDVSPEEAIKDIDKALAALEIEEPTEEEIQRRLKKNAKGGVPFDTGFVVTGRYDLSATSEIGLKAGLTEEQKKLFSYFVPVRGMSEQIVDVLDNDRRAQREGTSKTGNIMLIGRKGSGKTVLAVDIVKAIQKQRNLKQGKVAIIAGDALSKKDIGVIFQKLHGGALIIEKAGSLSKKAVIDMNLLMERKTGELLIVLEDQKKPMERLLTANPEFRKKFTSKLELPVFVNDELVTFGQTYAKENGCKLDEMGILALYSRIDVLQREDHAVSVAEVKDIMDEAIEHSKKANVKHLARRMFGKRKDEKNRTILTEEDFRV